MDQILPPNQFYCCPECEYKTNEYNMFYEHVAYVHNMLVYDQYPTFDHYLWYCCHQCDFRTTESVLLQDHLISSHSIPKNEPLSDEDMPLSAMKSKRFKSIEVKSEPISDMQIQNSGFVDAH